MLPLNIGCLFRKLYANHFGQNLNSVNIGHNNVNKSSWTIFHLYIRGPNRVFGKTEDYGFLSVKKMKTELLAK